MSISERNKNNNKNSEKSTEKKNLFNLNKKLNINNNNDIHHIQIYKNKNKIYKRKRNYISMIHDNKIIKNINNNNINININNINDNKKDEKNNSEKKDINSNINIEKQNLLLVDNLAQELVKIKSEEELKKYLFYQLLLLDDKKRKINIEQIKYNINALEKDEFDLTKSIKAVSRAVIKKEKTDNELDLKVKNLENEINKVQNNIRYYQYLGDCYKNGINKLKQI